MCDAPFSLTNMRFAFVLRLGNDTRPTDGFFEGWVEEVDTCTELRFRSTEQLLKFLGQRFDLAMNVTSKARPGESHQSPEKKSVRGKKRAPRITATRDEITSE